MKEEIEIRPNGSRRVKLSFDDEVSLTRQEFKDECDLNLVIKRFMKTPGGIEALQQAQGFIGGRFLDVSEVPDYRTTRDYINRANEAFMRLPAPIRSRFANDPAAFLDFVDNPANLEELKQMGLVQPELKKEAVVKADEKPPV